MSPTTGRGPAIRATALRKTYHGRGTSVTAVDGIDLTVPSGSVFGLLGPNGAGKSTTVKLLTTLTRPDSGTAEVAGVDVLRDPAAVRQRIGYVSQKPGFDPVGTGRENLALQGRIYGLSAPTARRRTDDLLERFGLSEAANRLLRTWSGGMQRKLDVAMGIIHQPEVLFLDEPTTGLDPEARVEMWSEIASLAHGGLTVLLTTHYLDEADRLADDLVIIDAGRIVAAGSPEQLKSEFRGDAIEIGVATPDLASRAVTVLSGQDGVREVTVESTILRARVADGARALPGIIAALDDAGVDLTEVAVARPSLDDVYLRYAGRSFQHADTAGAAPDTGRHAGKDSGNDPRRDPKRQQGSGDKAAA